MRNLKKILAMALTVLMVVGSFAMTASAESYKFDDVTDYQEAIEVMAALKVAKGYGDGTFGINDNVTREQMALWIAKIMTGKTEEAYVINNFMGAVENLTAFADIDEENYVGAINYAANNGIIVGTSATTFEAGEAIKIQDVFAMVVRMLGYGSTAMNQQYPWSFIDKAISLGLDEGLAADYSVEAAASRGETMQILYNALTALKSDGSTLGYDFFGLEKATVVITGTAEGNAYSGAEVITKTVDDEDYVSFAVLSPNGVVSADATTYYALKSAFGIEGNANFYVGKSFVVRTNDGFASFLTIEGNDPIVLDQDAITGAAKHGINDKCFTYASDRYVSIDGESYKLVKAYSNFVDGTKTNNDNEIIMMDADGTRDSVYDFNSYVMDKNLNILDENGAILLYWVTTHGVGNGLPEYANLNGTYLYKIGVDTNGDPVYVQPNDYIWSLAAKASIVTSSSYGFNVLECSYDDIEEWDAYSDTVLYDDDNDGDYDRGVYYQYKFGYIDYTTYTLNGVGYPYLRANGAKVDPRGGTVNGPHYLDDTSYYNADGEAISYNDIAKKYVLYWYSPLYETMIVKEIFEGQTGLVTGVDLVNKTITFNGFGANIIEGKVPGESYTIGNEKLKGADYATLVTRNSLKKANNLTETIGKNINFIEKDGKILAIYNAVNDAKHMVYVNDNPGYTTMGYKNILAYYDAASSKIAPTMSVVTVNAMNNYWYSSYINNAVTGINSTLTKGALLAATEDSLGNYDISIVELIDANEEPYSGKVGDTNVIVDADGGMLTINNGILSSAIDNADTTVNEAVSGLAADAETVVPFTPFKISASTVWIVWDGDVNANNFKTFVGIPADGAYVELLAGATVYYESAENFVYVVKGNFKGAANQNTNFWGNNAQNTTIIYVTSDTTANMVATNAYNYGLGVTVGMTYSYDKAIDVVNGGFAKNVMTDYNFNAQLLAGHYYLVENGYVTKLADDMMTDAVLMYADNDGVAATSTENGWSYDYYVDADENGEMSDSERTTVANSVFPYVYVIESDGAPFYSEWDEKNLVNILDHFDVSTSKYYAKAKVYAAGYDTTADATTAALDGVAVKVFLGNALIPANTSAPVFIQKAASAVATVVEYDADAAAKEELAADWEEVLAALKADVSIYAWDTNGAKTNADALLDADITVTVNDKTATFENTNNGTMKGAVAVAKTVDGVATITLTGKSSAFKTSDAKALINSYKIFATSDNGVYTFDALAAENIKTETYNVGADEYTKVTLTVDNSMIVNLDTDVAVEDSAAVINNARILVLILCK